MTSFFAAIIVYWTQLANSVIWLAMGMRDTLGFGDKEYVEIRIEDRDGKRKLILTKGRWGCVFCGEMEDCLVFHDQPVCQKCIDEM